MDGGSGPRYRSIADDDQNPHQSAGIHTELSFKAMCDAADMMIKRQIEGCAGTVLGQY